MRANRIVAERLSNGDENKIVLCLKNNYPFGIQAGLIDEIPHQFQKRDFYFEDRIEKNTEKIFSYILKPTERGEYSFGALNVYVKSYLSIVSRKFKFDKDKNVAVYPSYLQMRKYELMAISNRLTEMGIKRIRRISNNNEFEQIRDYIKGDDFSTINWKATARRTKLMVNQFIDERSQQVYAILDMGRTMKMPFEGMSLLDYSINSALIVLNTAMIKQDKAGLISFEKDITTHLSANRKPTQMKKILESLYKLETQYQEANYEMLYNLVRNKIKQRSLLLIYTNFEGITSMHRQLPLFRRIAKNHLLVVIFFENTEIEKLIEGKSTSLENIYIKTIAEKFMFEKRQIVKDLNKNGIQTVLSKPTELTINSLNKYIELKAKGLI